MIFLALAVPCVERLELYKFAKLFHDGGGDNTFFHPQFCEISEREDAVYDDFEWFWSGMIAKKTQLLYKRRNRKGMRISGIDSLAELWDWAGRGSSSRTKKSLLSTIMETEGQWSEFIWKNDLVEVVRNEGGIIGKLLPNIRLIRVSGSTAYNFVKDFFRDIKHIQNPSLRVTGIVTIQVHLMPLYRANGNAHKTGDCITYITHFGILNVASVCG